MTKAFKLILESLILFFYVNEGPRIHVHIRHKNGNELKVWLDDFSVSQNRGFKLAETRDLIKLARYYEEDIKEAWKNHFCK